jgi:hypothetical protein
VSNYFQTALRTVADRRLAADSALLSEIWNLQLKLNQGHFDRAWVAALMQPWNGNFDVYDAWGFSILWSALIHGRVAYAVCAVGQTCHGDRSPMNQEILSNMTSVARNGRSVRCKAEFIGGPGDNDGKFSWLDPLEFDRHGASHDPCRLEPFVIPAGSVALEVGTTSVGATFGHIFAETGVARWPYGSEYLYVFYPVERLAEG